MSENESNKKVNIPPIKRVNSQKPSQGQSSSNPSPSPSPTPNASSSPSPTPSSSPSPSPTPSSSPSPSPTPNISSLKEALAKQTSFTWEELNRLKEMFDFFDRVIAPMFKKYGVDPKIIAFYLTELGLNSINIMLNKSYQEAPRGLSIESAIMLIDEELPKLLSKSKSDEMSIDNIISAWNLIKRIMEARKGK